MTAYDLEIQNTLPTRVTSKSKTFLDHMITNNPSGTKTIETTIGDLYTVLLNIAKQVCLLPKRGPQSLGIWKT